MSKKLGKFQELKSIALRMLGKADFDKDPDGKAFLTDDDKAKMKSAFSDEFITKFENALDLSAELDEQQASATATLDQLKSEHQTALETAVSQANAATDRATKAETEKVRLEAEKKALQETVDVLSHEAEVDAPAERILSPLAGNGAGAVKAWNHVKADRKSFHNQMAFSYLETGDSSKLILAQATDSFNYGAVKASGNTINTEELTREFGDYMSQFKIELEIKKLLTQPTESQKYMTTKMAIKSWKASKAKITSIVQQFVALWTPLGNSTFSPIEIINRRHKINVPITPNDITDGWLTYLYKEEVTPDQMPITRYIIEQLLRPQIAEDIELLLIATGVYEELGDGIVTGDSGQATGKSMDGYLTILKALKANPATVANFFDPTTVVDGFTGIDENNVLVLIDGYTKWIKAIAPKYHAKGLNMLIDPEIMDLYNYAYRDKFADTKNQDGERKGPDFSKLTFVPLEAMRGSGVFFCTPTDNFIRLIHTNEAGAGTNLQLQVQDYTVKIFGEFWLACGFALQELIFAYVPETESSGSGA